MTHNTSQPPNDMTANITLFDFPSGRPDQFSFSPFTWATRFSLNIKKVPYTTTWATHDQIESVCKENDIPRTEGSPLYTFPCIIDRADPSNVVRLMDSHVIAEYLDKTYPNPPLNPNNERTRFLENHGSTKMGRLISLLLTKQFFSISPPGVLAHFEKNAPIRWGMPLEAVLKAGGEVGSPQREGIWEQIREGFEEVGLKEGNKWLDGGEHPEFKDCVVLGWLMMIYVGAQEEGWPKVVSWADGKWKRYWEVAEEYIVVN